MTSGSDAVRRMSTQLRQGLPRGTQLEAMMMGDGGRRNSMSLVSQSWARTARNGYFHRTGTSGRPDRELGLKLTDLKIDEKERKAELEKK